MGKKKDFLSNGTVSNELLAQTRSRRRSGLFLRKYLTDEADKVLYRTKARDEAHKVLKHWADLEQKGYLAKKETALDNGFLEKVFGDALGYRSHPENPEEYQLEVKYTVEGVGTADAALGNFRHGTPLSPLVVMELKSSGVNLDRDRFNGRTAVQQCWDYLNALPNCTWGIVSNFVTFRLYHKNKGSQAYEEFTLQELRGDKRFAEFYCIFERGGLVYSWAGRQLRAVDLLQRTETRQRAVGDELYNDYSSQRARLIEHLMQREGYNLETAIYVAQRIIDRIIFVAFCEDRDLLREKTIWETYRTVPPFAKATNPRWRNFLELFRAMDQGHKNMPYLEVGFNGGLFKEDPRVDDLQLDDDWTEFFKRVGDYDFRDEVNVEVLGHLFEKSVAELEKLRIVGPYALTSDQGEDPAMQKSAERKRFGIYYTPPDFTKLIVDETVRAVIRERFDALLTAHGLTREQSESENPSPKLAVYWRDCLAALRDIKVCDPACGSGAFLIAAYDVLEEAYNEVVDRLVLHEGPDADDLADDIPNIILADNLYGADVEQQAVEITQLALWVRSAQRGKRLADLSKNVVWANSLVTDPAVHDKAMQWELRFPEVFSDKTGSQDVSLLPLGEGTNVSPLPLGEGQGVRVGPTAPQSPHPNPLPKGEGTVDSLLPKGEGTIFRGSGFDCVIGNPPWERMKLQEREFFAFSSPKIAGAVNAADRRKLIGQLKKANPELNAAYVKAGELADRTLAHIREAGNFPLTAKKDLNTYAVFAELAHRIVAPHGRVGLLVPSGIATDLTTCEFFGELMKSESLIRLFDFENKAPFFPDVHRSFKFTVLVFGGKEVKTHAADFAFFLHGMEDLEDKKRHIRLSSKDMALLNPNTHTCPVFRSLRDAELTKAIYGRVPILIDRNRKKGGNPWGVKFVRMFDQTNAAEQFHTREDLLKLGAKQDGNLWKKGKQIFLPLYEAKMVQAYDHRAAGVVIKKGNWFRQGQTEKTSLVFHQNPEFLVEPRWWAEESAIKNRLDNVLPPALLAFKNVTSPTNRRTMIAAFLPPVGVINSAPLILFSEKLPLRLQACLLANLNSFVLDYVARQKIGNVNLNYFLIEQLSMFSPERYSERCPWNKRQTLEKWISDRVLKLSCTADDMQPLGEAAGLDPPVHKWNPREREELLEELDAAFFLLYGIDRDDAEYILGTFSGAARDNEESGLFGSAEGVLEAYDRLAEDG